MADAKVIFERMLSVDISVTREKLLFCPYGDSNLQMIASEKFPVLRI